VAAAVEGALAGAAAGGDVQVFEVGGRVSAAVVTHPLHLPFLDERGVGLFLEADPAVPGALDWAADAVARAGRGASPPTFCALMTRHLPLLPALEAIGLGLDSIALVGQSAPSLAALGAASLPPREMDGLTIEPLRTEAQVDAVVAIRRAVFSRHPEYCWFGARPRHLSALRARMLDTLDRDHLWWVMLDSDGAVQGIFGSDLAPKNPFWGPRGGLEIIFAPEVRGRGFATAAYRRTLEGLVALGFPIYKGTTGNPVVLALGHRMGRSMVEINLRAGATFPRAHFAPYLT
jgi:hypothetical protein